MTHPDLEEMRKEFYQKFTLPVTTEADCTAASNYEKPESNSLNSFVTPKDIWEFFSHSIQRAREDGIQEGLTKRIADLDRKLVIQALVSNKKLMHDLGQEAAKAYLTTPVTTDKEEGQR